MVHCGLLTHLFSRFVMEFKGAARRKLSPEGCRERIPALVLLTGCLAVIVVFDVTFCSSRQEDDFRQTIIDQGSNAPSLDFEVFLSLQSPFLPEFNQATKKLVLPDRPVWIDVGANVEAENKEGVTTLAFEPIPWFWEQLKSVQRRDVYAFPFGVGNENALRKIQITRNGHSSSLLPTEASGVAKLTGTSDSKSWDWRDALETTEALSIYVVRLEAVIDKLPVADIDYLKIDAQGYDLEVLKSAGKYLKSIRRVKLEAKAEGATGFYKGQPSPSEIIAFMQDNGFRYSGSQSSCCNEKLMEVDMMFDNEALHPSSNTDDFSRTSKFLPNYP